MPRSHHTEWLELVEVSGPSLSLPVLERVFPQGLDAPDPDHAAKLRLAHEEWAEERSAPVPDPEIHDAWIRFVLTETLEFTPEVLFEGEGISSELTAQVPEHDITLRPDFVVSDPNEDSGRARLLIRAYHPEQDLEGQVPDGWAASPAERMTQLCRETEVRLGLLTNGDRWMFVDAPPGEAAGYASFYASLFSEEPLTLRAFRSLLGMRRFFWVEEENTLEAMLAESATYQAEVTEQLGAQVRRAVEVLVQSLDRADADTGRELLRDVTEADLYEASLTVMMRLVFLFFAEENDLLPLSDELYQANYAASTLRAQLREEADHVGVEVLERRQDAWCRLLATFRAIHGGVEHDQLHLPAYGSSLFNPDRFCFLEGRASDTTWATTAATPLPIDNRTVLHLLDALQLLRMKGRRGAVEARRLSFRSLDIEQIGHVYEMLLDHTAARAMGPGIGLIGTRRTEPEVGLDELDELTARGHDVLVDHLVEETRKSRSSIEKALAKEPDPTWAGKLRVACGEDQELSERVLPFHALVRTDPWGEPVVIPTGAVYVTSGTERRSTGTYYTPRALTEEIVTHALEPVVYRGPAEGTPREDWELLTPAELLELKICDPAMGSGAFLVQVVRWLSDRLLEAWDKAEQAIGGPITPEGRPIVGGTSELLVPTDPEERAVLARRLVAERCIYGVDVNPLAVEMAKLSLWLVTLAKGRPFSFLDHALRCGDSLLGVYDLDQIRAFHPDPATGGALHATFDSPIPAIEEATARATELRRELESFTVKDVRDAERKADLQREAERATSRVKLLGDLVIGAALCTAVDKGKGLDRILESVVPGIPDLFDYPGGGIELGLRERAWEMLNAGKPPIRPERRPFHWPVEFPEAFSRKRAGFDTVVGNPPFMKGHFISGRLGSDYREYLAASVVGRALGSADLCSAFLVRYVMLSGRRGITGLLATNSIAEGDAREVGLGTLLSRGVTVLRAVASRPWPGSAAVFVSVLHLTQRQWHGERFLDGTPAPVITSSLRAAVKDPPRPHKLRANARVAFSGHYAYGEGFVLEPAEAASLIAVNSKYRDVLFPYLRGIDLTSRPDQTPTKWAIFFGDMSLEEAAQYPLCLQIVEERVKPQRDRVKRARNRERWWQFAETRPGLRRATLNRSDILVHAFTSKYVMFFKSQSNMLWASPMVVIVGLPFGLLQSSIHEVWVRQYASRLKEDLRYTATDCLESFPLPDDLGNLDGGEYYRVRAESLRGRDIGSTDLYNLVHDPQIEASDVQIMRSLHVDLDRTVARVYGWSDLDLDHGFHDTAQGVRFTVGPAARDAIVDRLLELNHIRHDAEVKAGLAKH